MLFRSLLSKNTELSYSARHALTRLIDANDPEIDEQLREILSTSKEPTVKLAIAQALTEKGDEVGVNALLEIPWASNNLVEPHRALAQSPSPTASVAYYQLLCSDSAYQADIARHVLEGVCENPEKFTELKSRWEQYASQPEVDPKLASEMRGYVSDLQKASELDIEHTYRFSPQTLKKIISHRELDQQTPRAATNNKEAIVIFPKADDSNAFVNMDRQIRSLFEQGYDVKFFESGSDTHLVELLAERSKAGKQTDLLVLGGHGMREMLSLGASDPAEVGLSVPLDLVIDPTDVPAFQNSGANGVLKSGGKVVLVSCSTGNGTKNNDNLANTMREIFPQAAKHGIIAPQYPTTFEAFEFNRKGEVTSVQYSVDPYLAKLEVPDPIDIEHA